MQKCKAESRKFHIVASGKDGFKGPAALPQRSVEIKGKVSASQGRERNRRYYLIRAQSLKCLMKLLGTVNISNTPSVRYLYLTQRLWFGLALCIPE